MGKRNATGNRAKTSVDQYRQQLGKHEKHMTTSRSRDYKGQPAKTPKYASSGSSKMSLKYILQIGVILALLLGAIAVIYFVGFMGVVQVLYDTVEMVKAYWGGSSQEANSKEH